ncbi:glutamate receptor-like [Penaeus japonicus]|uniref:glutamate receptor-like n=1 Tax=Penaeus japonicus TaxID=27405 RepID=UPI001C70B368|nr:glutamate receptor-like [Penaeus japonicus]
MALSGSHLRVAADEWYPFVLFKDHEDGSFTTSGLMMDFMRILTSKLNFTFSVIKSMDGEWGRVFANGSVTGMIGMCHRKEVDMALGPFSVLHKRSQVIDYSEFLYIDSFGIFLPRPYRERDLSAFVKPLAWQIWLALLLLMVASMAFGAIYDQLALRWSLPNATNRHKGAEPYYFRPSWILKVLLLESIDLLPSSLTGRVLLGTWMAVSLILSSAYQSILTSLLAVPKVEVPVDSLQDLLDYGKIPWSVEHGAAIHQVLDVSSDG